MGIRRSLQKRPIKIAFFLFWTAAFGFAALELFELSVPSLHSTGNDITPNLLVLTSERNVSVAATVNYYEDYSFTPEGLTFGKPSGSLPQGDREIEIQFTGGRPSSKLSYSILLSQEAAEIDPVGIQIGDTSNSLFSSSSGSSLPANCDTPQMASVAQVLYGQVQLNPEGAGTVDTVGQLQDQHSFLTSGQTQVIGLINIEFPVNGPVSSGGANACVFSGWPHLSRIPWYSPSGMTGEVTVGPVESNYDVDSANPSLADLSSLAWQIDGPTAITYTLTDNTVVHRQQWYAFLAGIAAAMAATFAVEAVKAAGVDEVDSGEVAKDERYDLPREDRIAVRDDGANSIAVKIIVAVAVWRSLGKPR